MRDTLVMTRLDQLRALADPLRLSVVEAAIPADRTVAELAKLTGVPVTRLYHHVDTLVAADLIEVTGRVRRRGAEERRFRAVARRYTVAEDVLELAPGPDRAVQELLTMSRAVFGGALEQVTRGLESGVIRPGTPGRGLLLHECQLELSAPAFAALARELPEWLEAFAARHRGRGGSAARVVVAGFPIATTSSRKGS